MPAPTTNFLTLNGHPLPLDPTDSDVSIESLGAQLGIRISARWPTLELVRTFRTAGLLPDYAAPEDLLDEPLVIRFSASKVFEQGLVPSGEFVIEEGKHRATHSPFYIDGLDYGLEFFGRLTLSDTEKPYVEIDGTLRRLYEEGEEFSLRARLHYDADGLQLEQYQFTSLEELRQIGPERVRLINLTDYDEAALPHWLADYTGVRDLYLGYRDYLSNGPLTSLPDWLAGWTKLESLSVYNYALAGLPNAIGELRQLKRLFFGNCTLTELPPSVWTLPHLEQLLLSHNQLSHLPAEINLPRLTYLDLNDNQLQTLPATLFSRSPNFRTLSIEQNDFRQLNATALAAVPEVRLEVEVRQRLAPKPPAAGGGDYDASAYHIGPARLAQLDAALSAAGIEGPAAAFFRATTTPAIGFRQEPIPTDYTRLGCHRFGGLPDLPAGHDYPRFGAEQRAYEFIAQLDCADLAPHQRYLPRTGFLFCFLSTFHDLYAGTKLDYPVALLQYHDVERSALRPGGPTFAELTTDDYFEAFGTEPVRADWGTPCYRGFDASATPTLGIAPTYPLASNVSLFGETLPSLSLLHDDKGLDEITTSEESYDHVCGGYGFSQHELPAVLAAHALGGDPTDYILLLEVKSRGDMQWGDAGELHLVIHKGALARRDFSRVFAGMYSS